MHWQHHQVQIVRSKMDPAYVSPYKNMADCVKQTIAANGFRGPFQGLGPTLLRNTPANGVYLGSFELMKQGLAERYNCKTTDLSGGVVMACGGLGGILYWLTIFPVDQVKSAMQTDSIHKGQRKFPSMATTVRLLWADGGLKRFYKGFTPCIIRAAPANGAMLFTVNMVLNALNPQA